MNSILDRIMPVLSLIKILDWSIKKARRSRLRGMIRGYQTLKWSGNLNRIAILKERLTELPLGIASQHVSSYVFGAGSLCAELVVRQYLLTRIGYDNLNRSLLIAVGRKNKKVIFPLPKEWRELLNIEGFATHTFLSCFIWWIYILGMYSYGIISIIKILFSVKSSAINETGQIGSNVYFMDLAPGNLPRANNHGENYDVVSWYIRRSSRTSKIKVIHHGLPGIKPYVWNDRNVISQIKVLRPFRCWSQILSFAIWGLIATFIAALDLMRGRWWHALILSQAALAAQARISLVDDLAVEYLFNNSGWIYRPLWTYEVERRGAAVTFYFYAANTEGFLTKKGYPASFLGYRAMNWPRYLVWDSYQADFVRRAVGKSANIEIVGPIWFHGGEGQIQRETIPSLAIFDVTPVRQSFYVQLGLDNEFYTPAVINLFLEHITEVTREYSLGINWKAKKNIGSMAHPQYRQLSKYLQGIDNVKIIDPKVPAIKVIVSSIATISLPFTSTAIIANELGRPSVYYDPTSKLLKSDRAAHGIPILSGIAELRGWVATLINNSGELT